MSHQQVIVPGAQIGILGDGQLARMIALDGARLGYKFRVLGTGGRESPAGQVSYWAGTCAPDYSVGGALFDEFVDPLSVVLCEFENVPVELVERIEARGIPACASSTILGIAQNRVHEKNYARNSGLTVVPYREIRKPDGTLAKKRSILKTCESGYDGKSQVRLNPGDSVEDAWFSLGGKPCVLEEHIDFVREISVIIVRSGRGAIAVYGPFENVHQGGILRTTSYPAKVTPEVLSKAVTCTTVLAQDLNLHGILCVEYFVTANDAVLFNEMAARPHNSGHVTQRLCAISQFEAYVRTACNLELGSGHFHSAGVMHNIIGSDMDGWLTFLSREHESVHHYGKATHPEGRKVGHRNMVTGCL